MNFLQQKILIPASLVLALFTTLMVSRYIHQHQEAAPEKQVETQPVVVAAVDLSPGTKLSLANLKTIEIPKETVPMGTYSDPAALVDRVVKTTIYSGEFVLDGKLSVLGSAGGFSGLIPIGMRAMTVSVDAVTAVGGFILPNSRVDVLVTVPNPTDKEESSTRIVLEDVLVLAIDQKIESTNDQPAPESQTATLLVTPEQAEKLALGSIEGKLRLALRNAADRDFAFTPGVRMKQMIAPGGGESKPAAPLLESSVPRVRPQPAKTEPPVKSSSGHTVEILYSNKREQVTLPTN